MDARLSPTIRHRSVPAAGEPVYNVLKAGLRAAPAVILMLRFWGHCKSNCSPAIEAPSVVKRIGTEAVWPVPIVWLATESVADSPPPQKMSARTTQPHHDLRP